MEKTNRLFVLVFVVGVILNIDTATEIISVCKLLTLVFSRITCGTYIISHKHNY